MTRSRLLDYDPVTKARRVLHMDGDLIHAELQQDVGERLALNKHHRNAATRGQYNDVERAASIPTVIWEDLVRRGIANDAGLLKAWLDDPDNRAFRTNNMRLGK